ncbi:MAG: sulfatase [Acidobacteriota bacterium]
MSRPARVQSTVHARAAYVAAICSLGLLAAGCCEPPATTDPLSLRLIDTFEPSWLSGRSDQPVIPPTPTVFRFDSPSLAALDGPHAATGGWRVEHQVDALRIEDDALRGRSMGAFPVLRLDWDGFERIDALEEIHVTMRVDAGSEVAFELPPAGLGAMPFGPVVADLPWRLRAELTPGETRTYVLDVQEYMPSTALYSLLLRPSDVEGAAFSIDSVQLVFRSETLAAIDSGIGWQGLGAAFRETIVARSPETITWPVRVPERGLLTLSVGTIAESPVTFRVDLGDAGDDASSEARVLLEHTVTSPRAWQPLRVDLADWAGQDVVLRLGLDAPEPNTPGFWGTPAVRRALPPVGEGRADGAAGDGPPRIVLFVLGDTLRPDRLPFHGHDRDTAPVLTQLAEAGTVFTDTHAQGTWTKVSAPSIFTGLWAASHGVVEVLDRLPASAHTMAEAYRDAGYATYGLTSVPFTGRFSNLHQGYETLVELLFDPTDSKTARANVDRLLPWLDAHHDVPVFVFLHLFDPHNPYEPANEPWKSEWADPAWHAEHLREGMALRMASDDFFVRSSAMAPREVFETAGIDAERYLEREMAWYDGSIAGMDIELRRVVERLEKLGLRDDSLIVFTSDHGEEFHEHGRMFHGQSVYGELTWVPLVIYGPGRVASGRRVEQTVQTIDIMPTMLELSGLPVPEATQGRSLAPALRPDSEGSLRPLPAISEKPFARQTGSPPPRDRAATAFIADGWKLIHHSVRPEGVPEFELFDHRADPLDQKDLASENPEIVERMAEQLATWRERAERERLRGDVAPATADDGELDRLRSLGYVQ